jgi:gamma-glutamyltranspeptidase/glutathione hydrolase
MDAPRFRVGEEGEVHLEEAIPAAALDGLRARGHVLVPPSDPGWGNFGGGQIIRIDPESGTCVGGSDPRKDGLALGV